MYCGYRYAYEQLLNVTKDYKTSPDMFSRAYPVDLIIKRKHDALF